MVKSKCVLYLILKVATTKVMERPIYHNYPLLVFWEPSCLREIEAVMKLGRARAEVILKRKREPIHEVQKFFILRVGRGKGVRKADFVPLYPEIGVNARGEIEYMVAPNKNVNPSAYNVYLEYQLNRFIKTREERFLMKAIGLPCYEKPPEPLIKLQWHKWKGKDITDLVADDITWLIGPPREEKSPLEF